MNFSKDNIISKNQKAVWGIIYIGLFFSAFIDYAWIISLIAALFIREDISDDL